MDFEPYFKVHSLVSAHPKSTLCQMTNLNMILHEVVSVYLFVRIWNSSQFPAEFISERFRNGQYVQTETDTGLLRRGKGVWDTVRRRRSPVRAQSASPAGIFLNPSKPSNGVKISSIPRPSSVSRYLIFFHLWGSTNPPPPFSPPRSDSDKLT